MMVYRIIFFILKRQPVRIRLVHLRVLAILVLLQVSDGSVLKRAFNNVKILMSVRTSPIFVVLTQSVKIWPEVITAPVFRDISLN